MACCPHQIPLQDAGNLGVNIESASSSRLHQETPNEEKITTEDTVKTEQSEEGDGYTTPLGTEHQPKENAGRREDLVTHQELDLILSSSDDSVCRICQGSRKDSDEPLQTTRCDCKGATARIHESCLREWVRYQRSVRCEICTGHFQGITPPGSLERSMDRDRYVEQNYMPAEDITIHQLYFHLRRLQPFTRRRRAGMVGTIVFLSLVTCMSAIMSVEADREYRRVSKNPWSSHSAVDQCGILFSICVASAFFCATMTIGLVVLWTGVECTYYQQRRALYRRIERRLLSNMAQHV